MSEDKNAAGLNGTSKEFLASINGTAIIVATGCWIMGNLDIYFNSLE